jgi:chorismate dehydratase
MRDLGKERNERLTIGAVSYLNTKPLVYRLGESAPHVDLVFDLPSRLADNLAAGRLDVALIPSIEYLSDPAYTIVSDACIGCCGPVLSVKLLSRMPMRAVRTLALDEGSRTSGVLARILLWERFRLEPRLEPLPVDVRPEDCGADGVLLIGDRAIHPPEDGFAECWDLGDQWCRWSELPFVFAMWVARPQVDLPQLHALLGETRDRGVAHLDEIARREAAGAGLSVEQTLDYLRHNLHFHFGSRERRGLQLYYRLAAKIGAVSSDVGGRLDDCRVTG